MIQQITPHPNPFPASGTERERTNQQVPKHCEGCSAKTQLAELFAGPDGVTAQETRKRQDKASGQSGPDCTSRRVGVAARVLNCY